MRSWARVTNNQKYITSREEFEAELLAETGPTGPGWVIELHCYHYYNDPNNRGEIESDHVRKYMTTSFMNSKVKLPSGKKDANGEDIMETFTLQEMGLKYPLLLDDNRAKTERDSESRLRSDGALASIGCAQHHARPQQFARRL